MSRKNAQHTTIHLMVYMLIFFFTFDQFVGKEFSTHVEIEWSSNRNGPAYSK